MKRYRRVVGGTVRWEWELDDDEVRTTVLAILHALTEARDQALVDHHEPVDVRAVPGMTRCGLCGAWKWADECRTPHHLALRGAIGPDDVRRWLETTTSRRMPSRAPIDDGKGYASHVGRVRRERRPRSGNSEAVSRPTDDTGRGQA